MRIPTDAPKRAVAREARALPRVSFTREPKQALTITVVSSTSTVILASEGTGNAALCLARYRENSSLVASSAE